MHYCVWCPGEVKLPVCSVTVVIISMLWAIRSTLGWCVPSSGSQCHHSPGRRCCCHPHSGGASVAGRPASSSAAPRWTPGSSPATFGYHLIAQECWEQEKYPAGGNSPIHSGSPWEWKKSMEMIQKKINLQNICKSSAELLCVYLFHPILQRLIIIFGHFRVF